MNLNKAFLIGNLTRDPEVKSLPSGTQVASFGIATNRVWKNQQGEKQEDAQFHNIVMFGKQAEIAGQYLTKGQSILIEGRIQTRNWDAQDGSKKSRTEIVAESFQFGPRKGNNPSFSGDQSPKASGDKKEELQTIEYPEDDNDIKSEDIPF